MDFGVFQGWAAADLRSQFVTSSALLNLHQGYANLRCQSGTASLPTGSATELPQQVRSQVKLGNEGKKAAPFPSASPRAGAARRHNCTFALTAQLGTDRVRPSRM
jgi:hypothetical protein